MIACEKCKGKKIVKENNVLSVCEECIDGESLTNALRAYVKKNEGGLVKDLEVVLSFLPSCPVLAIMEAEDRSINMEIILLMKKAYNVKNLK